MARLIATAAVGGGAVLQLAGDARGACIVPRAGYANLPLDTAAARNRTGLVSGTARTGATRFGWSTHAARASAANRASIELAAAVEHLAAQRVIRRKPRNSRATRPRTTNRTISARPAHITPLTSLRVIRRKSRNGRAARPRTPNRSTIARPAHITPLTSIRIIPGNSITGAANARTATADGPLTRNAARTTRRITTVTIIPGNSITGTSSAGAITGIRAGSSSARANWTRRPILHVAAVAGAVADLVYGARRAGSDRGGGAGAEAADGTGNCDARIDIDAHGLRAAPRTV